MTGKSNETVKRAMKELNLAPETVADAITCPSGEVVLVLNSSRIVTWNPPPAGVNVPIRPSSAGPLGDGGQVGPPQCEEETGAREEFRQLWGGRRWRVRVLRAGTKTRQGYTWTSHAAEQVADALVGTPVACYEHLGHAPSDEVRERGGPAADAIVGQVVEAEFHPESSVVGGTIQLSPRGQKLHEALMVAYALDRPTVGLSVVTQALTDEAIVYRSDALGRRVSEGLQPVLSSLVRVLALDIVARPTADGQFLLPCSPPPVGTIREARVRESCEAVFEIWPVTDRVSEANGAVWKARIVRFGRSLNGWVWTKQSGEALVSHLQYAPVGVYRYDNGAMAHASEEAQVAAKGVVIRNVVGHLDAPSVETDGVYARLHVHEDAGWLKQKLSGLARMGSALGKVLGLSVDVLASYTPEGGGRAITNIRRLHSVDVVSSPSADGRIVRELEVA